MLHYVIFSLSVIFKLDPQYYTSFVAGLPNCWRRYLLVLKMRATPAKVSTHVSAHCFSAVSREWWMRMFPPPDSIFSLSAVVDDVLTQSNRWNKTYVTRQNKNSNHLKLEGKITLFWF